MVANCGEKKIVGVNNSNMLIIKIVNMLHVTCCPQQKSFLSLPTQMCGDFSPQDSSYKSQSFLVIHLFTYFSIYHSSNMSIS